MSSQVYSDYKSGRILYLYTKLINGDVIKKDEEAKHFGVHRRSIQRDIEDLRTFFENQAAEGMSDKELVYDKSLNCYYLCSQEDVSLSNSEILAVCKILLESRSMCRSEMEPIIHKLLKACVPKEKQAIVSSLIANELFHYVEPHHHKRFIAHLWDIGNAVQKSRMLKMTYEKQEGSVVERIVKPVGIMFSEYYFYLTAFIESTGTKDNCNIPDDPFPTIYRIDRIHSYTVLDRTFEIPYKDRFEEGEFRKRIQFMIGGKLRRIKFRYTGKNVDAILDRLPTAKILQKDEKGWVLTAEVFGNGIDMWIRSQGDTIEVLS